MLFLAITAESVEGIVKLLCPEKTRLLGRFSSGSAATMIRTTRATPEGHLRRADENGSKKDVFTGRMSFTIPSIT
jgi:hypothetical protein